MERTRLHVSTADHRSESNRSRRGPFTSLKSWSALFRSSPRKTPLDGRSLGCLSVLEIPDDPDILRTLPSPARSVSGDFPTSYLRVKTSGRPRAALSVPDNDEFLLRQPERPKNALKVRISTPPNRREVSVLATPPRAPLSPIDDFPSAFISSLEEFSKTTEERNPGQAALESSIDQSESSSCSANGPLSDFEGSTCSLQNKSKCPNLRTSSEIPNLMHKERKDASSDAIKPVDRFSIYSLESAKPNTKKLQTPGSSQNKMDKKQDLVINHDESKKSHYVSTDPCVVSATNKKSVNRTIKKISSFLASSPSRGVKEQPVKSTKKTSSIKIPRPWY